MNEVDIELLPSLKTGLFSKKNIEEGLHSPLQVFEKSGVRFFGLEAFDAHKKVILFVHGVADSPRSFHAIAQDLDREVVQPWFVWYPSGLGLAETRDHLVSGIQVLQGLYAFRQLIIVAHSMGGLLSYALAQTRVAPLHGIISISTPWGGDATATVGSRIARRPLWRDMAPGSKFLSGLENGDFPQETPLHLIFGFGRPASTRFAWPFYGNHDGFVSLSSQLPQWVQEKATSIRGFDCSHQGILCDLQARKYAQQKITESLEGMAPVGVRTGT